MIKVKDIVNALDGEVLSGMDKLSSDVMFMGAADMLSDVLALSNPGMIMLTGHSSIQALRTALVTDLLGLIVVRGKHIPTQTIDMARENNFLLITTKSFMYSSCGKLYKLGLKGIDEK